MVRLYQYLLSAVRFQVSNIDIMSFETSPSVVVNTRAWNKRTQGWLERYVYMLSLIHI